VRETRFDRTIENVSVNIDGFSWQNCTFNNCEIVVSKGDYDLINCHFNHCRLSLRDNAIAVAKVIELFMGGQPLKFIDK
jgi:hypothetical protein